MISTAIDPSALARTVGVAVNFRDLRVNSIIYLPQRVAVVGQGAEAVNYGLEPFTAVSAQEVGQRFGFGSPLHLCALQLLPVNGDGVGSIPCTFYPLEDDESGVAATGTITPAGSATQAGEFRVIAGGVPSALFVVNAGDSVSTMTESITAAINAAVNLPVIPTDNETDVDVVSKWQGTSANEIEIVIEGPTDIGVTFGITQPAGGVANPDIAPALALFGSTWETLVVNCMQATDTTALTALHTHNTGRWGAQSRNPYIALTGAVATDVATLTAVTDNRKLDRTNAFITAPGSISLPFMIAARAASRIAVRAGSNPAYDYAGLTLDGIYPGDNADQWLYVSRDQAVKSGVSPTELRNGVVTLSDNITMYRPDGDPTPAYRYIVDIVKLQNMLFSLSLEFEGSDWLGVPLIPDDQPTVNPAARQPKAARAAVAALIDAWALEGLISDPAFSKASIQAGINSANPKRLDITFTVKLSGNNLVTSVDFNFGFYFGALEAA